MKRFQLVTCLLTLAACDAKVDTRGYMNNDDWKKSVTIGQTREEVLASLGSPSAQSSFGVETWYYIASRKETMAFLKPEVTKQQVMKIEFDAAGTVSATETVDEKSRKDFDLVKRSTPTEGHSMGFFEQIMGNIGRFNKEGSKTLPTARGPGGY